MAEMFIHKGVYSMGVGWLLIIDIYCMAGYRLLYDVSLDGRTDQVLLMYAQSRLTHLLLVSDL